MPASAALDREGRLRSQLRLRLSSTGSVQGANHLYIHGSDTQDESQFVHSGTAQSGIEVCDQEGRPMHPAQTRVIGYSADNRLQGVRNA